MIIAGRFSSIIGSGSLVIFAVMMSMIAKLVSAPMSINSEIFKAIVITILHSLNYLCWFVME
ncbi:hypothetical protein PBCV1_A603aL [Paramecium bursaria Chlorella virus 1]|uniref:Uncharacterized protein n=1 Tax=Paramecium bursaria Chlorella virus 1 TaxID=10506 RepID=F8TU67_PBCV1|nr:hypothetical protein PBCV1_A603aL [Paramecium bursaria Chlorella virus 1]AEI70128.1 hypothetical protein [Paramecium bursaria Chlorella virus 1]